MLLAVVVAFPYLMRMVRKSARSMPEKTIKISVIMVMLPFNPRVNYEKRLFAKLQNFDMFD